MAVAAEITMRAETSKAPTIGIMTLMATPVTTYSRMDMNVTGRPDVGAVASSKLMT